MKVKRLLDLFFVTFILVFLSPVFILIAFLILISMGSPVFFCQPRPGYKGKIFTIFKFRTMSFKKDDNGNFLSDENRLTLLGMFLRKTSLDELPEVFNVIRGDMSMVGPRPLLVQYLQRYTPMQNRRHEVKPGITGWAQINGRNAISWEDKFRFDVWYVDNWTIGLDIKILFLTLVKIVTREGINQPGQATAKEFMGKG